MTISQNAGDTAQTRDKNSDAPSVGLFVTCLVDLFRPTVGFAAIRLLENAGCTVVVPPSQTCCGQPAHNSGDLADSRGIAKKVIQTFETFDYVVVPSGSCASTIAVHYPELFARDAKWAERARSLADKTFELISFLTDIRGVEAIQAHYEGTVTYHDSCSGLRELGIRPQPRKLLASVTGLTLREMEKSENCCGFGGTFSVKYPAISNAIVEEKTQTIEDTGANMLLGGDLGCLMNMAGKLSRDGKKIRVRHIAEVLADMCAEPAIGEEE